MTFNHKDVLVRSAKTFLTTFATVYVTALTDLLNVLHNNGLAALQAAVAALLMSAVGAGLTALLNYWIQFRNGATQ